MNQPVPTASAFSNFVYRRTVGKSGGSGDAYQDVGENRSKWIGRISEENMRQYHAVAAQCQSDLQPEVKKWTKLYEGMADDPEKKVLECRYLTVNGTPMRCCPDLVLESDDERKHKTLLIVERKVRTGVCDYPAVPDLAYPNVRAQLWCYAWISDWDWYRDQNVILMVEYFWHPYPEHGGPIYMGCRGIWCREDPKFNREAGEHFKAYGGVVNDKANMRTSWLD